MKPEVFWYNAPTQIALPFNIVGLVVFELFTMHWCVLPPHPADMHPLSGVRCKPAALQWEQDPLIGTLALFRSCTALQLIRSAPAGWRASAAWT